jgi:hypothetical protein
VLLARPSLSVLLAPRWRSGSGVDEGPTAVASKRTNENWEVIQAKRRRLNLYSKVSATVRNGPTVEACISTIVHRFNRC